MKSKIAVAIAFSLSISASAAERQYVMTGISADAELIYYVDAGSIKPGYGNEKSAWVTGVYNGERLKKVSIKSTKELVDFDCDNLRHRSKMIVAYKANDEIAWSNSNISDFKYVVPESTYDEVIRFVCTGDAVEADRVPPYVTLIEHSDVVYKVVREMQPNAHQ